MNIDKLSLGGEKIKPYKVEMLGSRVLNQTLESKKEKGKNRVENNAIYRKRK